MERLTRSVVIAVASSVLSTLGSPAEAQSKPPANSREMLLVHWNDIGGKVVKLAEEFPEDKYNFKPVDDVRTFADQLRHVAFWNNYLARTAARRWTRRRTRFRRQSSQLRRRSWRRSNSRLPMPQQS